MIKIEDVDNKKEVFKDFFIWLFDDDKISEKSVSLLHEIDFSLCPNYQDPNIYYPIQFQDFFNSKPMQRLGRISQLGLAINFLPNLYHNRLEHSKGVYNKKLEEFFYQYQNPSWKKYIEDNNLKLYLIADLIKMAGHDIGHLPLSHALEDCILEKRGAHEEIGKKIMLENEEIQKAISRISPHLNQILSSIYNTSFLNFNAHDESNYDVDRLDYLARDSLYSGQFHFFSLQPYQSVGVELDSNNNPKENKDNSIYESPYSKKYIDVYDFSSLSEIQETLLFRLKQHEKIYFSPQTQIIEASIKNFLNAFMSKKSFCGQKLYNFVSNMKTKDFDMNLFLSFDDLDFYSELLEIAENHPDSNIRDLATMIIPNMKDFLTVIYSFMNINQKSINYSEEDITFLSKIKDLISSNSVLSQNLRKNDFCRNNILLVPKDTPFLSSNEKQYINSLSRKTIAYKKSEPIYIRDKYGKIFELSKHPDFNPELLNPLYLDLTFINIPYLRFNGISNNTIEKLKSFYTSPVIKSAKKRQINMQPLKTGNSIEEEFLEI